MVPNDLPMDTATGPGTAGLGGMDSSGLMATPVDDHIPYTNPCKAYVYVFGRDFYQHAVEEQAQLTILGIFSMHHVF